MSSDLPTGFETTIRVPGGYRRVEVEALDSGGGVLGTSSLHRVPG